MGRRTETASKRPGRARAGARERTNSQGVTTWQSRFYIDGRPASKTLPTKEQSDAFEELIDRFGAKQALEIAKTTAAPRAIKSPTVATWCASYIDQLDKPRTGTKQKYRRYLANDIAAVPLGSIRLAELHSEHLKEWIAAQHKAGSAKATIENKLRVLSGAFNLAMRKGLMDSNPAHGRAVPDGVQHAAVFLSSEEFDAILAEVPQRYKGLVEFLVESGCRWGEAVALQPQHVDRANSTVHIRQAWSHRQGGAGYKLGPTKTMRSDRIIDIDPEMLDKIMGDMADGQEWLFVNANLDPIHANTFHTGTWKPALNRVGMPAHRRPRIHDLRHTHASWLLARRVPMFDVSRRLGHSSIATTDKVYSHCAPDAGNAIVAALRSTRGRETL